MLLRPGNRYKCFQENPFKKKVCVCLRGSPQIFPMFIAAKPV